MPNILYFNKKAMIIMLLNFYSLTIYSQDTPIGNKIVGNGDPANYYIGHYSVPGSDGLDLHWYGGIRFGDRSGSSVMQITNGNVGIGTTNPMQKFVVSKGGAEGLEVYLDQPYGVVGLQSYNRSLNSYSKMELDASQFSFMYGNVGIGTANPTSKLTVAGDIHSREVKVTVNAGADFVFAEDYDLPSLGSVDKYIRENKHLPEIASAKEMQANGMNLSEMNIKLLQKVEELTLYIIEQSKRIEKLEMSNNN